MRISTPHPNARPAPGCLLTHNSAMRCLLMSAPCETVDGSWAAPNQQSRPQQEVRAPPLAAADIAPVLPMALAGSIAAALFRAKRADDLEKQLSTSLLLLRHLSPLCSSPVSIPPCFDAPSHNVQDSFPTQHLHHITIDNLPEHGPTLPVTAPPQRAAEFYDTETIKRFSSFHIFIEIINLILYGGLLGPPPLTPPSSVVPMLTATRPITAAMPSHPPRASHRRRAPPGTQSQHTSSCKTTRLVS